MKAIINGRRYDTSKADLIGEGGSPSNVSVTDFSHYWEALYKTPRSGQYFLAGGGGPMTKYARSVGGGTRTEGQRIFPLTREEALQWAEHHMAPDEIETHFGDCIEDA